MKILLYADTPTCNTGFGIVSKSIVKFLLKNTDSEIDILGINERGVHDELRHNPRVIIEPAADGGDLHGRIKLIKKMSTGAYNHIIMIHDLITVLQPLDSSGANVCSAIENLKPFYPEQKYHFYFPIDSEFPADADLSPYEPLKVFDSLIPYTRYASKQIQKIFGKERVNLVDAMYHGVDTTEFYPLPRQQKKQLRKELFDITDKRPVISIIARNQWRKDIAMSIHTFKEYKKLQKDAFLYIHSKAQDVGGNFMRYLEVWGLKPNEDYMVAKNLDNANGIATQKLNEIYNASDLILSSAHGEGFGLPYLEAMATKTAIMTPALGVEKEILPYHYVHEYTGLIYESSGQDGTPFPRASVLFPRGVAEEIDSLLQETSTLKDIKDIAYDNVKEKFDWDKNLQILLKRLV